MARMPSRNLHTFCWTFDSLRVCLDLKGALERECLITKMRTRAALARMR